MNIVVCVKRVADSETRIRIAGNRTSIDPAAVKFVMNPYDEFALEAALRQRESEGTGEVTLLTVGPGESAETLRAGLALGADQGVLLKAESVSEGMAVASALAEELRQRQFDIVLFGFKAIDDDLQAVGPMVAQLLDIPAVTAVSEFTVEGGRVVAQREVDGGVEVVELKTPCAMSLTKGPHAPRYASLKGIMAAKKKPLEEKTANIGAQGIRTVAMDYPPDRKAGQILTGGADSVPDLLRLLHEEARIL